jgi:molecular chaperone GrpE
MVKEKNNKESTANNLSADEFDEKDMTSKVETEITETAEEKLSICEDKLQRALADYQNLERRNSIEVSQKILQKTNQLMLSFIGIYEDFIRAKTSLVNDSTNIEGLAVVIKNMETFLSENNIKPIEAIGEIFDPKFHEAVSTIEDNSLDEGTITQEVAKGYISFQEVIKPSKVIVSKKVKGVMKND